jgi:hypothetical protein
MKLVKGGLSTESGETMQEERKHNFITLYLPRDPQIRQLFWQKAQTEISVSGQILKLMAQDMLSRGIVTAAEHQQITGFKFHRTTRVVKTQQGNNYSLYIPKDLWWVLDRMDQNLKGPIPFKNRSRYIWSLFKDANAPNAQIAYTEKRAG